jgi:hypothetical protein
MGSAVVVDVSQRQRRPALRSAINGHSDVTRQINVSHLRPLKDHTHAAPPPIR